MDGWMEGWAGGQIDTDRSINMCVCLCVGVCVCVCARAVVLYTFTHKQYIEQHNSLIRKITDRARLCELYPGICLTTEEKAQKNLSQGNQRVPVGMMKTEYTEQNIHNNKNT
jgi:hypothetical protein